MSVSALRVSIIVLGVSLAVAAARAVGEQPVLLTPPGTDASHAYAAPMRDGYGVLWWDYRDWGTPGRVHGGLRFARVDRSGHRVGDETLLTVGEWWAQPTVTYLEVASDGFVAFLQNDGASVHSARLDTSGRQLAPTHRILESWELYPASFATAATGTAMTYVEWYGTWQPSAQLIGSDGIERGHPLPLEAARADRNSFMWGCPIARDGGRFLVAWNEAGAGLRLRELSSRGEPSGEVVRVPVAAASDDRVAVAVADGRQAIVYSDGAVQKDVVLVTRDRAGLLSSPRIIAGEAYDEGVAPAWETVAPLRAVGAGDRLGVLYVADPPGRSSPAWFFQEFDLEGRALAGRRDLGAELGMDWAYEVALTRNEARDRYVLAWGGLGPRGWGAYYVELVPER